MNWDEDDTVGTTPDAPEIATPPVPGEPAGAPAPTQRKGIFIPRFLAVAVLVVALAGGGFYIRKA